MKRSWYVFIVFLMMCGSALSQEQPQEKKPEEPPSLEIPEITIIGKKAITLPFARKGELYDVNIYEAPLALLNESACNGALVLSRVNLWG